MRYYVSRLHDLETVRQQCLEEMQVCNNNQQLITMSSVFIRSMRSNKPLLAQFKSKNYEFDPSVADDSKIGRSTLFELI